MTDTKGVDILNAVRSKSTEYNKEISKAAYETAKEILNYSGYKLYRPIYRFLELACNADHDFASKNIAEIIRFGDKAKSQMQPYEANDFYLLAELFCKGDDCKMVDDRLNAKSASKKKEEKKKGIIYEKTFTFKDTINEYGQFYAFNHKDVDIKAGDVIEVVAEQLNGEPFSGEEIAVYRGKNKKNEDEWIWSSKGFLKIDVRSIPSGKKLGVSMNSRKDLKVNVKIIRQ